MKKSDQNRCMSILIVSFGVARGIIERDPMVATLFILIALNMIAIADLYKRMEERDL